MTDLTISTAVKAMQRKDYGSAQKALAPALEDATRIDFKQAVILQFSLLEKQFKAEELDLQAYSTKVAEKVKMLLIKCPENDEDFRDYLSQRLIGLNEQA